MVRVVALPAEVELAVRAQIDARDLPLAVGVLGMALAAELPGRGLTGPERPRRLPVLGRSLVASLAAQRRVVRDRLGPGDLLVAGGAGLGDLGRPRIVGIVALDAGFQWVVEALEDLREAGRPRGQVLVACKAGPPSLSRDERLLGFEIVGVFVGGAVADLAGQLAVV